MIYSMMTITKRGVAVCCNRTNGCYKTNIKGDGGGEKQREGG